MTASSSTRETRSRHVLRLGRDRRGTVAVIFGLLLVPIMMLVALAVDFASLLSARSRADLAADAAALTAVTAATNEYAQNPLTQFKDSQQAGLARFNAQLGSVPGLTMGAPQLSVTYDKTQSRFTSQVTYSGTVSATLAGIFGAQFASFPVGNTASATMTSGPFVDIQVLLDASSSMLIGATPNDISRMTALSRRGGYAYPAADWWGSGCAFACHWDPKNNDFYAASRSNSVTLRLDVLKSAIAGVAQAMKDKRAQYADNQNRYRLGLYTFSKDVARTADLTTNLDAVAALVPTVSPPLADPWHAYETNLSQSIRNMASNFVAQAGDGSTANTPKKFVFLMTDGVEDVYAPGQPSDRRMSAFDPKACDALKAKGVSVIVLHTVFYNPDGQFTDISAIQSSVAAALRACASSPSLYFEATDTASINQAIQAMLNAAIATPARFTQ